MKLRARLQGVEITTRDGWHRSFRWRWLTPFAAVPAVYLLALLVFDPVPALIRSARGSGHATPRGVVTLVGQSLRVPAENLLFTVPEPRTSDLPSLHLFVPANTLDRMQTALREGDPALGREPGGTQPYFGAHLVTDASAVLDVKVALRGASAWHHRPEKPSLRVKLRRDDVRDGQRYIELSRPESVLAAANWIPDQFAARLGLQTQAIDHVRLFINRKPFGVYLRTMRPGEPLAIRHDRLPGTYFKGDFSPDLWRTSDAWRQAGEDDPRARDRFEVFLELLRTPPDAAVLDELATVFDLESYARWAALMIVTGSAHTDRIHNHLYFLCPNQGRIEAVPWDVNAFGIHVDPYLPPDFVNQPVMQMVLADPRWVHRRNEHIFELLETHARPDRFARLVDDLVARLGPDLRADEHLGQLTMSQFGPVLVPGAVSSIDDERDQLVAWATRRHDYLRAWLDDARVSVTPAPDRPGWSTVVVRGAVAVDMHGPGDASRRLFPGLGAETAFHRSTHRTDAWDLPTASPCAPPVPLSYLVEMLPADARFTNAVTGSPVRPEPAPPRPWPEPRTVHPEQFPALRTGDVVLGPGPVAIERDLVVGAGQRLIIRAGTQLRLAPGVGIYARGVTLVQGTADAPVTLEPDGREPWAAFGVSGSATAGSRFEHMSVRGGSLGTDGIAWFKGMFNVYDCPDVVLRHCRFGANRDSDDAVSLAESRVLVESCTWEDAASDALDLDLCEGSIRDCVFLRAGNDGLDLMGSTISVTDCRFDGCGDKGVSVGERTRLLVHAGAILGCSIGCEVKDDSRALFRGTVFDGCPALAVHAYQKKWLYGRGGTATLDGCRVRDSRIADASIQRRSELRLRGTTLERIGRGADRVREVTAIDPTWTEAP